MLVDVVRLRVDGVKLTAAQVQTAPRIRGELLYTSLLLGAEGRVFEATIKSTSHSGGSSLIPDLTRATIRKIEGPNIMIVGEELHGGFRPENRVPQAWWCKIVG